VIFTTLDLQSAFNRFPIHEADQHKTAFTWKDAQYVFARAPFGLKSLPSKFQRVIHLITKDLPFVRAFMDDLVVFSTSVDEHTSHDCQVINALNKARLILNVPKCHSLQKEIKLLGFLVNQHGHSIDPQRLNIINSWGPPQSIKELQHFLG